MVENPKAAPFDQKWREREGEGEGEGGSIKFSREGGVGEREGSGCDYFLYIPSLSSRVRCGWRGA